EGQDHHRLGRRGEVPRRSIRPGRAEREVNGDATTLLRSPPAAEPRSRRQWRPLVAAAGRKLLPFSGLAALLAIWQLLAASGRYTPDQLPSPLDVWRASREAWAEGTLVAHVGASLARFAVAYLAAVAVAVPLG